MQSLIVNVHTVTIFPISVLLNIRFCIVILSHIPQSIYDILCN